MNVFTQQVNLWTKIAEVYSGFMCFLDYLFCMN